MGNDNIKKIMLRLGMGVFFLGCLFLFAQDVKSHINGKNSESAKESSRMKESSSKKESSNSKTSSNKKDDKKSQVEQLNSWYKNEFRDKEVQQFEDDGIDYYTTDYFVKNSVMKGFKDSGSGDLLVVVSRNRMKAEGLTAEDMAAYGFNIVLSSYPETIKGFDNIDSKSNTFKTSEFQSAKIYIEYEQ